jgi:transposase
MGQAIAVTREVRQLAKRAKDVAQARRLLAMAAVLDGASRRDAAKVGGMDRQTLRDWVIRFNEKGPDGLVNIPSPGVPPKLDNRHKAFLARIVDEGPIPRGRWRGALASLRSHHAIARGVWAFGIGRYGLPRLERIGLLARERQAEALQAGRRRHGRV